MAPKTIREIARLCADCGTCQSACPVYQAELTEPNSPRGKVNLAKALAEGRLAANARNRRLLYQCLVCGGCEHACPQGVEFTAMMVEQRNLAAAGRRIPWLKKAALFLYQGFVLRRLLWLPRLLARTPLKRAFSLPAFAKADLKGITGGDRGREYDVLLYPGCVFTYFYPQRTIEIKALLERQGFSVLYPPGLRCCGFPYLSQGWGAKFATLRKRNEAVFRRFRFKRIVVPCSTGVLAFRKYYDLPGVEVLELTDFMYRHCRDAAIDPRFAAALSGPFTYHDPCHNLKSLKLQKEARHFLERFGDRFRDDDSALCCGFGGIFKVGFPATAKKILEKRTARLNDLGAAAVVTSCPGCYMQLKENLDVPVYFFSDIFEKWKT
jgi:glycolate oxidase iron-sulfur subunit